MGILMNQKGYVGLIVLNIGFRAGVVPPSIFSMLVITMIISSSFTIPLISMVVEKSLYEQNMNVSVKSLPMEQVRSHASGLKDSDGETLNEAGAPSPARDEFVPLNELSILLNLPKLQTVPSVMSLIQLLKIGCKKITVNALKLNEITDRESSVLMATMGKEESNVKDPIMEVTQSFGQLNGIDMKPLFAMSGKGDFPSQVIKSSIEQGSNLILIPISASLGISDLPLWSPVFRYARCAVTLFLDRGFGITKSHEAENSTQKEAMPLHNAYFAFLDNEDDEEALSLISYMIQDPDLKVQIASFTDKTNAKLEIAKGYSNVSLSYHPPENMNSIIAAETEKLERTDLIILGKEIYRGPLKTWVDQTCSASVLVVQKHAPQKTEV
jgi:hypothetical protein